MFRNYIKVALRNIKRSRLHSVLNMTGLSMGIAFTLLIAAYIWSEWRVNRQLNHADRQFILTSDWKDPNLGYPLATLGPLARALKEGYPALVANYYRFDGITSNVSLGDKHFRENIQIGDSTLLGMYGFPLLQGDPRTALTEPFTIVITTDRAIKYFGRSDVVGKTLTIENFSGGKQDFRITGVMDLPSRNSVTRLNEDNDNRIIVPAANLAFFGRNMDWANGHIANYIELQKGVRPEALTIPIARLVKANTDPSISDNLRVVPIALPSYYLKGNGGTVLKMIYTLLAIAFFILLMAVINFVNLSISRSASRMKEIGIRKVLGGMRRQLIMQFLTESVLLALVATALALLLYRFFARGLSGMLDNQIPALSELPAAAWALIPGFAVFVGCLAGLYPAFLLSALPSVDSLKGRSGTIKENIFLRKGLVGFQFALAVLVLIGAIIISQQISLFFSDRLGYNKEYIVSSQLPRDWTAEGVQKMETIRQELANTPDVRDVTLSYEIPDGNNGGSIGVYREGGDSAQAVISNALVSDERYASVYQIPMAAGEFFHSSPGTAAQDTSRVVINETESRALGWKYPREAVGQRVHLSGNSGVLFTVSGVVRDFHFGSMGSPVGPNIFVHVQAFLTYRFFRSSCGPAPLARRWRPCSGDGRCCCRGRRSNTASWTKSCRLCTRMN